MAFKSDVSGERNRNNALGDAEWGMLLGSDLGSAGSYLFLDALGAFNKEPTITHNVYDPTGMRGERPFVSPGMEGANPLELQRAYFESTVPTSFNQRNRFMQELMERERLGTQENLAIAQGMAAAGERYRTNEAAGDLGAYQRGLMRSPYASPITEAAGNRYVQEVLGLDNQRQQLAQQQNAQLREMYNTQIARDMDSLGQLQAMKTGKTYEAGFDAAEKQAREQAMGFAMGTIAKIIASLGAGAAAGGSGVDAAGGGASAGITGAGTSATGGGYTDIGGASMYGPTAATGNYASVGSYTPQTSWMQNIANAYNQYGGMYQQVPQSNPYPNYYNRSYYGG